MPYLLSVNTVPKKNGRVDIYRAAVTPLMIKFNSTYRILLFYRTYAGKSAATGAYNTLGL